MGVVPLSLPVWVVFTGGNPAFVESESDSRETSHGVAVEL
jgi:hypothetical protein